MKRRAALLGGAAAIGLAAGGATAWWRGTPGPPVRAESAPPDFWSLRFEPARIGDAATPASDLRGRPLLINFWATWCPPCVTEMPELDAFWRRQGPNGWRVLALAVDSAAAVRRFVADRGLALPVALAGPRGIELSRALGNSAGALPFTVCLDRDGEASARKLGAIDADWLRRHAPDARAAGP